MASGCATSGAHHVLSQAPSSPGLYPRLLAVYMPWFGDHSHIDVGYSSEDPGILRRQIQQAKGMGISAFVVDWYGLANPYSDHNFALMQAAAGENRFQVALLYNEPEDEDAQATDAAIAALDEAYRNYIGPAAKYRPAYLTYEGRPMIFIFPKRGHVDWNRVRARCANWESAPLFIYKDQPPAQYADDFAGSYAWVQPDSGSWAADGSNLGERYLDSFYKTMLNQHPDKIVVGGAWPGFDDSAAKWGLNRHMQNGCGTTLDATLHLPERYFDNSRPLPFLMIETWNDYEEGTAIERRNSANCNGVANPENAAH